VIINKIDDDSQEATWQKRASKLSAKLKCPVFLISAQERRGLEPLKKFIYQNFFEQESLI
jgi:Fe2+ transport system protein B